jgi:hypothetical protein
MTHAVYTASGSFAKNPSQIRRHNAPISGRLAGQLPEIGTKRWAYLYQFNMQQILQTDKLISPSTGYSGILDILDVRLDQLDRVDWWLTGYENSFQSLGTRKTDSTYRMACLSDN